MELPKPILSVLGQDPGHRRRCNINANAFQQDAVVSFRGWQYAVFYSYLDNNEHERIPGSAPDNEPLYIHLARRKLPPPGVPGCARPTNTEEGESGENQWEVLVFEDYPQTTDDGHNTVQMGICPGDGTIHLAYDHHCDVLRYRHSIPNLVALSPADFQWTGSLFSSTLSYLPGISASHRPFRDVTYPRFGFIGSNDMFLSFRDGKAGLGNDHLYIYQPSYEPDAPESGQHTCTGKFTYAGQHLTGLNSNPYVNGITYSQHDTKLHITWVYRGFVDYPGWDDPFDTKHKQQAGPNGAENNHDLCYAYSQDGGYTWRNGNGEVIADLNRCENKASLITEENLVPNTITNNAPGIVAFKISKGSGLMNQEAQAVDAQGRIHVLNRDSCVNSDKKVTWKHYFRDPLNGKWISHALPIIPGSKRGRLATRTTTSQASQRNDRAKTHTDLYIIFPGSATDSTFRILRASSVDNFAAYTQVWSSDQLGDDGLRLKLLGEPLVDSPRLEYDHVLSLFCLGDYDYDNRVEEDKATQTTCQRAVVLLDFELPLERRAAA
ncbi:hypothetical protein V8F20_002962 [Naviculisporaceae sp. PSN 640]